MPIWYNIHLWRPCDIKQNIMQTLGSDICSKSVVVGLLVRLLMTLGTLVVVLGVVCRFLFLFCFDAVDPGGLMLGC